MRSSGQVWGWKGSAVVSREREEVGMAAVPSASSCEAASSAGTMGGERSARLARRKMMGEWEWDWEALGAVGAMDGVLS